MKKKRKYEFLHSLLAVFVFISFIVTISCGLSGIKWMKNEDVLWIEIALVGLTFFLLGLLILTNVKNPLSLIFILVGCCILGFSLSYGLGNELIQEILISKIIPIFLLT